jgi:hypothetical protein
MIGEKIVVDAVVHPYDLAPSNQIASDFSFEAMAQAEFVESPVDLAVIHALPGRGFAKTHVTAPQRAAAVAHSLARDEFSQARAQGVPAPWSALRGTTPTPCA